MEKNNNFENDFENKLPSTSLFLKKNKIKNFFF